MSRAAGRLAAFRAFLQEPERASITLIHSANTRKRMMFALPQPYGDTHSDRAHKYIPGLSRILEAEFFSKPEKMQSTDRQIKKKKKQVRKRRRDETGATLEPLDLGTKVIAGAEIDGVITSGCRAKGKAHGIIVHSHIQEMLLRYMSTAVNQDGKRFYFSETEERCGTWDPCAIKFCRFLMEHRLLPLASECVAYDSTLDIATAIDAVVMDQRSGRVVFVEVKSSSGSKCGFLDTTSLHGKVVTMRGEMLQDVAESKYHRAVVQLAATMLMAKRGRVPFAPDEGMIVYLSSRAENAIAYPMPDWYTSNVEAFETWLHDALQHRASRSEDDHGVCAIDEVVPLSTVLIQSPRKKSTKTHKKQKKATEADDMSVET